MYSLIILLFTGNTSCPIKKLLWIMAQSTSICKYLSDILWCFSANIQKWFSQVYDGRCIGFCSYWTGFCLPQHATHVLFHLHPYQCLSFVSILMMTYILHVLMCLLHTVTAVRYSFKSILYFVHAHLPVLLPSSHSPNSTPSFSLLKNKQANKKDKKE